MYRDYVKWWSPSVGREMEFLWFGQFGRPVILFPPSNGRFYEYENVGIVDSLAGKIAGGEVQLVLVDSQDHESWYNRRIEPAERVAKHAEYDAYLRNELAPYVFNRAQRGDLGVFGADFGAYHAANFAGRYPDLVSRTICFSGIYDVHCFMDGKWDESCYYHCPTAYIPNMSGEWLTKISHVGWVIATGEYDTVLEKNRAFSQLLGEKGIQHHFEVWPHQFGHEAWAWCEHLKRFV